MKYILKIISIALLISLSLTSAGFSEDEFMPFMYEREAELMEALSLMYFDPEEPAYEEEITRGEFASIVAKILGVSQTIDEDDEQAILAFSSYFRDVDEYTDNAGDINALYNLGLISGNNRRQFLPDDPILYEEAIKILVSALGYNYFAEGKGGFPMGYLMVANEKGVIAGFNGNVGEYLSYGDVAKLVANSLKIDILEQQSFGGDEQYNSEKGKTLLTEKMKIFSGKGVVTGTYFTKLLSPNSNLRINEVQIDNNIFIIGEEGLINQPTDLFGYYVDYYYKLDDITEKYLMVHISSIPNRNSTFTLYADWITDFSNYTYSYRNGISDKEKSISISKSASIIYNGRTHNSYSDSDFKPDMGQVTMLDNNSDGKYDIIFIKSYVNYYVSTASNDYKKVIDSESSPAQRILDIDENDNEVVINVTKNERPVGFTEIKTGCIISVYESADKKLYNIVICETKVQGVVEEVSTDEFNEDVVITIGGKARKIATNLEKILRVGDSGEFYLDFAGNISGVNFSIGSSKQFGYLWESGKNKGIDPSAKFEILTSGGEYKLIDCAEKVIFDGYTISNADDIAKNPALFDTTTGLFKKQLIAYLLDGKGNIKMVDTTITNPGGSGIYQGEYDNLRTTEKANRTYKSNVKGFVRVSTGVAGTDALYCGNHTVYFEVLPEPTDQSVDYKRLVSARETKDFRSDTSYNCRGYYTINEEQVDVIIRFSESAIMNDKTPAMLVQRISKGVDVDNELVHKITGIQRNAADTGLNVQNESAAAAKIDTLHIGDVILFRTDAVGAIYDFEKIFNIETKDTRPKPTSSTWLNESRTFYGNITKYKNNILWVSSINPDDGSERLRSYPTASSKVYVFDTATGLSKTSNIGNLQEGQTVFVRVMNENIEEVVILK